MARKLDPSQLPPGYSGEPQRRQPAPPTLPPSLPPEPPYASPQPPPAPAPRSRLRSLFWPGFIAGFVMISIVSCGGMVVASGLNRIDLSDIQGGSPAWTPPLVTPTPTLSPESQPPPLAEGLFGPGDRPRNITNSRVNLRGTPGYLGKPEGDVVAQVYPGETVEVLGESSALDGLAWWRVRYVGRDGAVVEGWIAEATAGGVQILGD